MLATVYVLIFRELQLVVVIYIFLKVVECIQTHKSKDEFKLFIKISTHTKKVAPWPIF